jgi:hypothetical protein
MYVTYRRKDGFASKRLPPIVDELHFVRRLYDVSSHKRIDFESNINHVSRSIDFTIADSMPLFTEERFES